MLGEVRLDLRDPVFEPAGEPALPELVLDAMKAPVVHIRMIGRRADGHNEPFGLTLRRVGPIRCRR